MTKPLSLDLRERVVAAVDAGAIHVRLRLACQLSKASTARMMAASADIQTPETRSSRRG